MMLNTVIWCISATHAEKLRLYFMLQDRLNPTDQRVDRKYYFTNTALLVILQMILLY